MGLLSDGQPLSWEETQYFAGHVREHGIKQFINLYNKSIVRTNDMFKWGDEIEYIIVKFDGENEIARVSLKAEELLKKLKQKGATESNDTKSLWHPEYGAFMVEGIPGKPYGPMLAHFNMVESNMRSRRQEVNALLQPDECLLSIANFPRLGCFDFTYPYCEPTPTKWDSPSQSLYIPDAAIYSAHPRFRTLTRNIRLRRGEKVDIKLKVFEDENTVFPIPGSPPGEPDVVAMDAMGFGMGCCCLQLTFQAANLAEARLLYDQLAPFCPIMLAITAGSPIFRGYLTETDSRWNVISASVDCRTAEERGLEPLKKNQFRIEKSRYDTINMYLSAENAKYNDVETAYDEMIHKQLCDAGMDEVLAKHVAHLFIRDTLSVFGEKLVQNDETDTDHFENIQSTNWQSMRFKPPPQGSNIGWRIEFRPCDVQHTDFENAAIVCFMMLLSRAILSYNLDFIIPISKIDENMQSAQKRDACRKETFWFRKQLKSKTSNDVTKMTIADIFNGNKNFPGLISIVDTFLQSMEIDEDTHLTLNQYLRFIGKRASGKLPTPASWLREQVLQNSHYKKDSIVSDKINYDVLLELKKLLDSKQHNIDTFSKTKDHVPQVIKAHLHKSLYFEDSSDAHGE